MQLIVAKESYGLCWLFVIFKNRYEKEKKKDMQLSLKQLILVNKLYE